MASNGTLTYLIVSVFVGVLLIWAYSLAFQFPFDAYKLIPPASITPTLRAKGGCVMVLTMLSIIVIVLNIIVCFALYFGSATNGAPPCKCRCRDSRGKVIPSSKKNVKRMKKCCKHCDTVVDSRGAPAAQAEMIGDCPDKVGTTCPSTTSVTAM